MVECLDLRPESVIAWKNNKFTRLNAAFYSKPRLRPEVQLPLPHISLRKGTPFVFLPLTNVTPFSHTIFRTLHPFNCCRRMNHCTKPENFFELFTLIKLPSVAFLGHFTDQVTDFPTISYTSTTKIPTLS